jgi:hypothetical protein
LTAYPEITPKMEFCPDWRPSARNPKNLTGLDAMSALQTEIIG